MKTLKIAALAAIALAVLSLTGCVTNFTAKNGKLAYAEIKGREAGTIDASARAMYIIHPQLISLKAPNESLETIIDPALAEKKANAVKGVTVSYHMDILAFIVNGITAGILGIPNVQVTGTAVIQ
jgi:hypothetical protein